MNAALTERRRERKARLVGVAERMELFGDMAAEMFADELADAAMFDGDGSELFRVIVTNASVAMRNVVRQLREVAKAIDTEGSEYR